MAADRIPSIQKCFHRVTNFHQVFEAALLVEDTGGFTYSEGYGGKDVDSPMVIASITKLFTTACILILCERGRLSLEEGLPAYFNPRLLRNLHLYKGKDYSYELTIYDLLHQTSGLPDVYIEGGRSLRRDVIEQDLYIDFERMLALAKALKPHFAPQARKRAYYADINFDLLGKIIEKVTNMPLEQAYREFIFAPLGLQHTYLPIAEDEFVPNVYYKSASLHRPQTVISSRASGGCISTARELMVFLKAFFGGKLFDRSVFADASQYRDMQLSMRPLRYGCGHMQIQLGGPATAFQGRGELLGHCGSTGSFAFYHPAKELFFVGDVNQMANPALPVRLAIQLAIAIK